MATHEQVVTAFFKYEDRYRNGSRIFFDDEANALCSFGRHFRLAVRRPQHKGTPQEILLNSDRYSSTTSGHQSLVIGVLRDLFPGQHFPRTSFAILDRHGLDPHSVEVVDFSPDDYRSSYRGHDDFEDFEKNLPPGGMYWTSKDDDGEISAKYWHLVGGVLMRGPSFNQRWTRLSRDQEEVFMKPHNPDMPSLFLGGTDHTGYFTAELVDHKVKTMGQGFESLQPLPVRGKTNVLRQGEFFFVPVEDEALCLELDERFCKKGKKWWSLALELEQEWPLQSLRTQRKNWHTLYGAESDLHSPHHAAQQMVKIGDTYYVQGSIRDREHSMVKLDTWHSAHHNRLVTAYSTTILGLGVD